MNIYKMTEDVLVEVKGQSWMDVGIHENVELVDIVSDTSSNGNHFLAFYFENEKGERASKTEWEVKAKVPYEQMDSDERDAYISKINNQMARVSLIARQFVDKSELIFEAPSFKLFADTIKAKLDGKTAGIKLRIKIVFDYNDWATLPSYVKYPWIEKMSEFPKEKSKIKILDNIDKMHKSQDTPDKLEVESNPFENTGSGTITTDSTAVTNTPF